MLELTIEPAQLWDSANQTFINVKEYKLRLEHSLVSLSKWESKWKKPFISTSSNNEKTDEETRDYVKCMNITQNIPDIAFLALSNDNMKAIKNYIDDAMTATVITSSNNKSKETITSEVIYYWMISHNIPMDCQKWHLNRLLTLIQVCNIKNAPPKKMSRSEILAQQKTLNAQRRAKYKTKG